MRTAVLEAAGGLVFEKGPHGVTIPEVAQRAGVAVTSVYRRWGDVASLLMDLAVERLSLDWPLPDTGSVAGDLHAWMRSIAVNLRTPQGSAFFKLLVATAPAGGGDPAPRLSALVRRLVEIEAMLQRARTRGEAAPTADQVIDRLLAPLYVRALLGAPADEAFAEQLVDQLLAEAAARAVTKPSDAS